MSFYSRVCQIEGLWRMRQQPHRDLESLRKFQSDRLRHVVRRAYEQIPFYRERFDSAGVTPADVRSVDDLSLLPIVSKAEMRAVPLLSRLARGTDIRSLNQFTTSGSTGEPFEVCRTPSEDNFLRLFRIRAMRQLGMRFWDRTATIIGAPIGNGRPDLLRRAVGALGIVRRDFIDCEMDDESIMSRLSQLRPTVISGYAGVISHIAPRIAEQPELGIRPRFVCTGGEPLTPLRRRRIEASFGVPVFDLYGAHEFNLLGWQCPTHQHLHTSDDSVILELLRDGTPVAEGECGEVVATALFSGAMPFIRYRLGDLAVRGPSSCPCGQPFSTLREIQGRSVDYLVLPSGRFVHPYAITSRLTIDREDEWIDQHQLVQSSADRVVLRVLPRRPPTNLELRRLAEAGRAATEPDLAFELALVDGFPPDPSGKFRSYLGLEQARESAGPEGRALPHEIRLVDNEFVQSRWDEISELLTSAFKDSNFSAGFSPERPAQHTWEEMHKPDGGGLKHVVAADSSGRLLGAIFCIRTNRPENETTSDVGWFFTDTRLPGLKRIKISDAMVERGHEELARAGYDAVGTEMGTEEGARYLSQRFGYAPAPLPDKKNRWIMGLRTATEHCVSSNSEKKAWGRAGGQLARYATADIAKDEVIIDLKVRLRRARHGAVDTLQLGEGLYYRSSEGPLCMNHHCRPNGYICFEDLTYRALHDVSAGDELTFNYCTTEYEMAQPFDCLCGSPNCLGRVAGCKYLDEIEVERIFSLLSPFLKSKI